MKLEELSADEVKTFLAENFPEVGVAKPEPAPATKRIVVGILSYDARMFCKTNISLIQAGFAAARKGWEFSIVLREGDSMVARGRNVLVSKFLEDPKNTHLFLIDCDLEFSAEDFIRLCEAPVDLVGGAYPYKDGSGQFPLRWPEDGLFEEQGLWEVMAITPGFMRISRNCLEKMVRRLPHLEYKEKALGADGKAWMLFDNACRPTGVYDEGYVFCEKWAQCGGKTYLDPECKITHIGLKGFEAGTVRDFLTRTAANMEKLHADFPHIPPLQLMPFAATREIKWDAVNDQFGDKGKAGASQENPGIHAAEHGGNGHDAPRWDGRGRPKDIGLSERAAEGQQAANLVQAARRFQGGEVRPGANGGAG
jgi:hypothetical protein